MTEYMSIHAYARWCWPDDDYHVQGSSRLAPAWKFDEMKQPQIAL